MKKNKQKMTSVWLTSLLLLITATPSFSSSINGGALTLNIDSAALEAAFNNAYDPNRPSFYVEEYFNSQQAASRTDNQILNDHIVPGVGVIPSTGLVFSVNGTSTTGLNKPNSFSFSPNDLTGTAGGSIGVGGAIRYRIDKEFRIDPITGEEQGNRAVTGYLALEYAAARAGEGHSGWTVFNHYSFRADVFDLDNVITTLTADSLTLAGDLALGSGFNHMGGTQGAIVGDFSFQTSVVPVPAAVWLFASGLAGMFISRYKQQAEMYEQI